MNKLINFFLDSNHQFHVLGGVAVYMIMLIFGNIFAAFTATVLVAITLEFKDKLYGNKFDLADLLCTVALPAIAFILEWTLS